MADNWVDTIAGELESWAGKHGDGEVDAAGVRLLLDLAREELRLAGPDALTAGALRGLMLDAVPESVVAGPGEVPAMVAAARHLIAFLRDTGAVAAPAAVELDAELDRIVPEFTEVIAAVDEEDRQAAAELVTGMMRADGVPLDDEDAVGRWIADFEALPDEERFARTDAYLRESGDRAVPPVRVAPRAELAAAARASGLAAQARALVAWLGAGRPVDEYDEPSAADALAAVAALELPCPRRTPDAEDAEDTEDGEGGAGGIEALADLPELDRLWWAAIDAGLVTVAGGTASPGPAAAGLDGADDGAALDAWLRLFDGVAVPEHDPSGGLDPVRLVQNELTGVLIHLYEQDVPARPAELAAALAGHVDEAYEVTEPGELRTAIWEAVALEIDDLSRWGVVEPAGGDGLALTPLGVWGVRELLLADGFAAPVVGDLADAPAADLVAGLTWHRQDTADEEIDGWLAGRDALSAARDLLAVMRDGGPGARNLAAAVLQRVGPAAEEAVREAAADRPVRPYAHLWLHRLHGGEDTPDLERDDFLWLFVDTVAGMLETAEPRDAVAAALADAPAGSDLAGMVDGMWRTGHPGAGAVLEALGGHHPDKAVAKAARTAAYKARSARSGG
ncbi:hypothetical protein [Spirillospora sp. NPDC029432]|uniref:hypothetical protein n=1 Tax=Spirillospora sp. NPDC029432 TaxID=3154599 RepID=UPI0034541162